MLLAAKNNNVEDVEIWLDKGGHPLFERDGWNAVLWAACNGNEELIRIFHRRGALSEYIGETQRGSDQEEEEQIAEDDERYNPFVKPLDARKVGKYTPLHWASYKGHLNIVWFLLRIGVSPLRIDMYGNSSVHQAAASGNVNVLQCYLSNGVDVNMKNARGHTPIDLCTEESTKSIIKKAKETKKCSNRSCNSGVFDFKNIRYYCEVSQNFFCKNCSVTMYVYNTHESEEKDRPVCRSLEVHDLITKREQELTAAIDSYEFDQIDKQLAQCERVGIDAKLRKKAETLHIKLENELQIENFLKTHQFHDNYKDIRKDVQKINDMLEYAQNNNIDID